MYLTGEDTQIPKGCHVFLAHPVQCTLYDTQWTGPLVLTLKILYNSILWGVEFLAFP